jgi:hypothetical protein
MALPLTLIVIPPTLLTLLNRLIAITVLVLRVHVTLSIATTFAMVHRRLSIVLVIVDGSSIIS